MAFLGFAVMNPIATMSMVDTNRWRVVVYAETPRTLGRYAAFLQAKKQDRKVVLFLIGALNLHKVYKDRERFTSVFVFDDLQNLHYLKEQTANFQVVDIKAEGPSVFGKHLTPAELGEALDQTGGLPEPVPVLSKLTNVLGKRRPSVLETTSRMPMPEAVPFSGMQSLLSAVKGSLPEDGLPFAVVIDTYVKYLFRITDRNTVTNTVTKKLPEAAKEAWKQALDFVASDIGVTMADAFRALCRSADPDFRIGHAVAKFGLRAYSGDFVYFTSLLPPFRDCQFLASADKGEVATGPLVPVYKPPPPTSAKAKKRGQKKAQSQVAPRRQRSTAL